MIFRLYPGKKLEALRCHLYELVVEMVNYFPAAPPQIQAWIFLSNILNYPGLDLLPTAV